MKSYQKDFTLNAESVDLISESVFSYLSGKNVKRPEVQRVRLSLENALLFWLEQLGEGTELKLTCRKRFGRELVTVSCPGRERNPFLEEQEESGAWVTSLKSSLESAPIFEYVRGMNSLTFSAKSDDKNRLLVTFGSVVVGIVLGFLGLLLPASLRESICTIFLTPLYNTYLNVLAFCCIPMIFISMITGIVGVGDLNSFTKNGQKMLLRYFLVLVIVVVATLAIALPFFHLNFSGEARGMDLQGFVELIFGWLPSGIFTPFINMDAMQLIIMGAVFGICILALNLTSGPFVGTINNLSAILLNISRWLTNLIPGFVCVTLVNSIWDSEVAQLLSAWKSWVITTGVQVLVILLLAAMVCLHHSVGLGTVLRKMSKTFLIALGTNSCNASVSENYDCCGNKLGIDPKVFSFGIPIGTTTFKPATAARLVLLCLFMAEEQQISVSFGWLLLLCIMALVLSIAIPAIPGGTLMFCAMFFAQMGLPETLVTQMLTTDIFFDCTCTAFNQIAVPLALVPHAASLDLLNEEILQKPE